jgi:hypothetical protein
VNLLRPASKLATCAWVFPAKIHSRASTSSGFQGGSLMQEDHIDNISLFKHLWQIKTRPKPEKKQDSYRKTKRPIMTKGKNRGKPMLSYLPSSEKMVALCLAHHRNPATLKCYPGYGKISDETGLDRKTIARAVDSLERAKIIWRFKVYENGELRRTQYFFMFDSKDAKDLWDNDDSPLARDQTTDGIEQFIESLDVPF